VGGVSPVLVQMWERAEPGPSADVAAASAVPVQMWERGEPV
jgi:hypothetical protein